LVSVASVAVKMRISLSLSLDGGANRTAASRSLLGHGNAARQEQPATARPRRGRVGDQAAPPPTAAPPTRPAFF